MSDAILMASGADDIDFMIHGLFSYELFGHKVWITTTHVCVLIVMLVLIGFAFVINRKMKHATDVPDTLQNIAELIVEKLDGMVENVMGENSRKFKNYISTIFFIYFIQQYIWSVWTQTTDCGLWNNAGNGIDYIYHDHIL